MTNKVHTTRRDCKDCGRKPGLFRGRCGACHAKAWAAYESDLNAGTKAAAFQMTAKYRRWTTGD